MSLLWRRNSFIHQLRGGDPEPIALVRKEDDHKRHGKLPRMPLIIIVIVLILLFGGGGYYMGPGFGYYGGGGLSLILALVLIYLIFGRGRRL
jgi:hypothetical protein